jgi:hypothetical protein
MTLQARAIALQGIGYGPLLAALQGFATVEAELPTGGPIHSGLIEPRRRREEKDKRRQRARLFEDFERQKVEPPPIAPEVALPRPAIDLDAIRARREAAAGARPTPEQIVERIAAADRVMKRKTQTEADEEAFLLLAMLEILDD